VCQSSAVRKMRRTRAPSIPSVGASLVGKTAPFFDS
jgi:hypothetical protein